MNMGCLLRDNNHIIRRFYACKREVSRFDRWRKEYIWESIKGTKEWIKSYNTESCFRCGGRESTYKRLEAGDGNPRLDTLIKIVKCLKTDLNSVVPQEHLCKDAGIWQIVRKLLSMDKKKMNKAIKAILAMLDAMYDD